MLRKSGLSFCDIFSEQKSQKYYTLPSLVYKRRKRRRGEEMANQFDELLSSLGTGRWNILFFVASSYWSMNPVPHTLGSAFFAPPVQYTCEPPGYPEGADMYNSTDNCHYLGVYNGTEGEPAPLPCTKWSYDTSTFTNTITMQFDLVCDSEYLRAMYQSIYMLGTFVGEPITGILSDRYGRKTVLTYGTILFTIAAIFSSLLPNFSVILAARFILGFLHPAGLQAAYILAMETCEPRLRTVMGIILGVPWALATATWGGWAYLIRDWRWLQLAVSLPCLLILPLLWFLDESPRWLIVRGHHQRAKEVLQRAARLNRVELPPSEELEALMKNIQSEVPRRVPALADRSRPPPAGQGGAPEGGQAEQVYVKCITIHFSRFWRRKRKITASVRRKVLPQNFGINSSICLSSSDLGWLVITLAMLGKFSISAGFQILYLYVTELFPTEVRLLAIGTSAIPSRIASTISPFVTDLLGPHYPWMPSVIFGIAALFAGVVTLLLHETHRMPLPDTIKELEERALTRPKDETKETEMEPLRT
ncbi:solute carrier family 22 member 8-like [Penaeus japonicus]|uniref:solute carrier family 22 member 8-like n=1 Tax=Penaeus japonicus TaxID=27405 RepID=UPI001C711CF6|nr:solute carrier family 22 member 8-like [Penaeus japonicus]